MSSSDSDADPARKGPPTKKQGTGNDGGQDCSTCGGPASKGEKAERKKKRDKKKPEQLRK